MGLFVNKVLSSLSAEPLPYPASGGKSFLLGGNEDVLENVLGLGDLADLTVANDDPDYSYDVMTTHMYTITVYVRVRTCTYVRVRTYVRTYVYVRVCVML